ncbi:DUF3619 family protein [Chitinimonas naiadis]
MTHQIDTERVAREVGRDLAELPLTLRQQTRLAAAREQALAKAGSTSSVGIFAGLLTWRLHHPVGARRFGQAAWVAVMLMAGLVLWHSQPDSFIDDDVDTQLLADEVPIEAWLSEQADMPGQGQS